MSEPPIRFPDGFRLLVCGGRDYADRSHVWATLDRVNAKRPLGLVIHGAARGADTLAADWALERSIETWAFPAKWAEEGRAAGVRRNQTMLEVGRPQGVVAFAGGRRHSGHGGSGGGGWRAGDAGMRFAYADPPYLGCGRLYAKNHPEAMIWDDPETHRRLIQRLADDWPDGWALSLHAPSLQVILSMCPKGARVAAACKTFAQIRPTRVQFMWEPVIFFGGRKKQPTPMVRDWLAYNTAPRSKAKDGTIGGKPMAFCHWVFDLLGAEPGDALDDLFPGTGAVGAAWAAYVGERSPLPQLPLEVLL